MPKLALSLSGDTSSAAGLTAGNMQFARQLGATHVVFSDEAGKMVPNEEGFWHEGDLRSVRERVEAGGLELAAIENFPAQHWDKILLGAEGREEQLANLSRTIVRLALLLVLPTSSSPLDFPPRWIGGRRPTWAGRASRAWDTTSAFRGSSAGATPSRGAAPPPRAGTRPTLTISCPCL